MSNLVHNEHIKLYAAYCNNGAVAALVTGVIIPSLQGAGGWKFWLPAVGGFCISIISAVTAHLWLGKLKE
jgi:hypothetical protein